MISSDCNTRKTFVAAQVLGLALLPLAGGCGKKNGPTAPDFDPSRYQFLQGGGESQETPEAVRGGGEMVDAVDAFEAGS